MSCGSFQVWYSWLSNMDILQYFLHSQHSAAETCANTTVSAAINGYVASQFINFFLGLSQLLLHFCFTFFIAKLKIKFYVLSNTGFKAATENSSLICFFKWIHIQVLHLGYFLECLLNIIKYFLFLPFSFSASSSKFYFNLKRQCQTENYL